MIQIRHNVFETNSSSTHSLTLCSEEDYNRWEKGELLFNRWCEEFDTKENIINTIKNFENEVKSLMNAEEISEKSAIEEILKDEGWCTWDYFWNDYACYYESFDNSYSTKSGETVVAFGYFGYDG